MPSAVYTPIIYKFEPHLLLRYNFPTGLGKGHDAAVVGSWLDHWLQGLDLTLVVPRIDVSFRVMGPCSHPGLGDL